MNWRSARASEYSGVVFATRLSAQWAAFFDLVEWAWSYRPFDDCGWSPDFVVDSSELPGRFVQVLDAGKLTELCDLAGKTLRPPRSTVVVVLGRGPFGRALGAYSDRANLWLPFACQKSYLDEWNDAAQYKRHKQWPASRTPALGLTPDVWRQRVIDFGAARGEDRSWWADIVASVSEHDAVMAGILLGPEGITRKAESVSLVYRQRSLCGALLDAKTIFDIKSRLAELGIQAAIAVLPDEAFEDGGS